MEQNFRNLFDAKVKVCPVNNRPYTWHLTWSDNNFGKNTFTLFGVFDGNRELEITAIGQHAQHRRAVTSKVYSLWWASDGIKDDVRFR